MQCCCSYSKKEPSEICPSPCFHELTTCFSVHLYSPANVLSKLPLFLFYLMVTGSYHPPNIIRSATYHLACIIPMHITCTTFRSGAQCDWHQTAFSPIIKLFSGHDFASLNTGAVVSRRLTMLGFNSTPPSTVLVNAAGECWSFHGTAGTFGVVLDAASIMPSHVMIHHRLFNSMTSLSCAPCQVIVWGMVDRDQNMKPYSSS